MRRVDKERYIPFLIAVALFALVLAGFSITGHYTEIQANSDLNPTAVSYSPDGPQTGDAVTFTVTVANKGGGGSGSSFKVGLYIDDVNVGNGTMAALGSGASGTANITWTATSELHDVYVYADPDNAISETDETNNRLNSSIGVDWPTQQQNNERRGYANTVGPTTNNVVWSRTLPVIINGYTVIVADGKVYTGDRDQVLAFDAKTGAPVWNYTVGAGFQYPQAQMTVANGILYTGTDNTDKKIYAFNSTDGTVKWSQAHNGGGTNQAAFTSYYQGMVHDSNPARIQARSPSDGSIVWNSLDYIAVLNSPVITNDTLYFVTYNYTAAALNAFSGAQVWMRDMGSMLGMTIYGPPAYAYGNLYFGTSQGGGTEVLYSLRASDGATNWSLAYNQYAQAPPAIFNGTVFIGAGNSVYARDALSGSAVWTKNLGNPVSGGLAISSNGIVYASVMTSNRIYALNAADGSIIWQYNTNGASYAMALYNNMLYATTENGRVYAFGPMPNITVSQTYNNTAVDKDSVDAATADAVPLTVSLSNNASDVSVSFIGTLIEPAALAGDYTFGTNNSVNGIATLIWNPPSDGTIPPGRYVWYGKAANYNTLDNSTLRVYGGMNASFKYAGSEPASTYNGTDNATVNALMTFLEDETIDTMLDYYNFKFNATLVKPNGVSIPIGLGNQTETNVTVSYLANGTGNSCFKVGGDHYIDFNEDLVPTPIPAIGGPGSGYYLKWICNSGVCPGYENAIYDISAAENWGSWNPGLDVFRLTGWGACTGTPGVEGNGWQFTVFTNASTASYFWNGTAILTGESGTWHATLNATADWFFPVNSDSRNFTIAGAAAVPAPAPQGGSGLFRNITAEAKNNIAIEAGVNTLTLGRGTSEQVDIFVENIGSVVLQDVYVEAEGLPYGWVTIFPSKLDSLGQNEKRAFKATINIPEQAGTGKYSLVFTVHNYYTRAEIPVDLTISPQCEQCPASGGWSACAGGKQTRTAYRCGSETDFKCKEWTEEQGCALPINNAPLLVTATAIGAVALQRFYFRKKPAAPVPQEPPEEGQPSPAFSPPDETPPS